MSNDYRMLCWTPQSSHSDTFFSKIISTIITIVVIIPIIIIIIIIIIINYYYYYILSLFFLLLLRDKSECMPTYQVQGKGRVTSIIIYKTTENTFYDDENSANIKLFLFNVRT